MIDKIVIDNLQDYKSPSGKIYSGKIEADLKKGKINTIDPRVPKFFKYFNNILLLTTWGSSINPRLSGVEGLSFKDKEEFLTIEISFSKSYKYTLQIDSGYFTECKGGGIFSETLENKAGQILLSYNFLDEIWENGQVKEVKRQPLINFGQDAFMYRDVLEKLRESFVYLDWSSELLEGSSLRTIRERLQGIYHLDKKYIHEIWSNILPTLDIGIEKVVGDSIFITVDDKDVPMPLDCQGSGAKMLLRSLPVLMMDDKTIFISNNCSNFCELHPILKKHLFKNIINSKTIVLQEIE